MIEARTRTSRQTLNDELVAMARCLADEGPNVNELARQLNRFKETVRYRYHKFFVDKGITVQAVPSYSKLGFKRLVLVARLAGNKEPLAKSIFETLSQLAYLHSYTRVLLTGEYIVHVAVPSDLSERCVKFYRLLCDRGFFSHLDVLEFDEIRNPPMKPEYFDFITGTWRFDGKEAGRTDIKLPLRGRPKTETYDRMDLLILKELDKNAGSTLVKMASALRVNLSALEFHYRDHVKARGLVKGYRLIWQGTKPDIVGERTISKKEVYVELTLLLIGASQTEIGELMLLLNKTPFLWSEAYGSTYCAEAFVANYLLTTFLEYLDPFATKVGNRLRMYIMDQSHARRYVIAYSLFDGVSRSWRLDEEAVLHSLGNAIPS